MRHEILGQKAIYLGFLAAVLSLHSTSCMAQREVPYLIHHNFPDCTAKPFLSPIKTKGGKEMKGIAAGLYCTFGDIKRASDNSGRKEFFRIFNGETDIKSVTISAFSVLDEQLVAELCRNSVKIPINVMTSWDGSDDEPKMDKFGAVPTLEQKLSKCLTKPSSYLQFKPGGGIISFHPKIYMATTADEGAILVVGSGHPLRGLSINFDHWIFYRLSAQSVFLKEHQCYLDSIDIMYAKQSGQLSGQLEFDKCIALTDRNIEPKAYFLPFETEAFRIDISQKIKTSTSIDLVMSSVGSDWMLKVLISAIAAGTVVRVVLDDDLFWKDVEECEDCQAKKNEYRLWVAILAEWGAKIRYLQTNQTCHRNSRLHHKFMLMSGDAGPSLLFGSLNFTDPALGRAEEKRGRNLENSYVSTAAATVTTFETSFAKLWNMARDEQDLPSSLAAVKFIGKGC